MKHIAAVLLALGVTTAAAQAQTVPDLKGTWTGKGKSVVFGTHPHHPGGGMSETPRVRDIEARHVVTGQDGRLVWGHSSSAVADTREPFAWAISRDNRTIVGADMDGYFQITLMSPNRMEKCYAHAGVSPSKSVVATCYVMDRKK